MEHTEWGEGGATNTMGGVSYTTQPMFNVLTAIDKERKFAMKAELQPP